VVNAAGVEDPALALIAAERGAAFVDIAATSAYVAALERSAHRGAGAGQLVPGRVLGVTRPVW
jgi:hypothetical protein